MQSLPGEVLESFQTQYETTLGEWTRQSPVLIVFLRHGGCPFCREALADIKEKRAAIEKSGVRIVLVHMMTDEQARTLFDRYDVADLDRISDPDRELYQAFGLARGSTGQVIGPRIWWQGFKTSILSGHLPGKPIGDIYQMPGAFLIADGTIVRAFRPNSSAQRPDYEELAQCELPGGGESA